MPNRMNSRWRSGVGGVLVTLALVFIGSTASAGSWESGLTRSADHDFDAPVPGTYSLPVLGEAADGAVIDSAGEPSTLHEVHGGKIVLLSFIYTRCPDEKGCPLAWSALYDVLYVSEEDRDLADHLKLVSLSFDPEHDTPAAMAAFAQKTHAAQERASPWAMLTTGSPTVLKPILEEYGQIIAPRRDPETGAITGFTHQLRVYLIDGRKRIRNIYGLGFLDPRLLLADVRTLILEARGEAIR